MKWVLLCVTGYAIFVVLWKLFWDIIDPPPKPPKKGDKK